MPGVILKRNTFVQAGSVVTKSTNENSIVYGNPQKEKKLLTKKVISIINNHNKNDNF
jgi:acetyltransferase-like isoleucine patch superfamily enzyme